MDANIALATFSVNEAACVTGVPPAQVHRIIDAGLLDGAAQEGGLARVVRREALLGLRLAHGASASPRGRGRPKPSTPSARPPCRVDQAGSDYTPSDAIPARPGVRPVPGVRGAPSAEGRARQ